MRKAKPGEDDKFSDVSSTDKQGTGFVDIHPHLTKRLTRVMDADTDLAK